jgi:hypothetical protein
MCEERKEPARIVDMTRGPFSFHHQEGDVDVFIETRRGTVQVESLARAAAEELRELLGGFVEDASDELLDLYDALCEVLDDETDEEEAEA